MTQEGTDPATLVGDYVAASQRARASGRAEDFEALRAFLHPDVTIRMASPWAAEPWRVVLTSAEEVITRLRAPLNTGSSLTTENLKVSAAGGDVFVEQLSTIHLDDGDRVTVVCHVFSVAEGLITGIRSYRNDLGMPQG